MDRSGNLDATPAVKRFTIKKRYARITALPVSARLSARSHPLREMEDDVNESVDNVNEFRRRVHGAPREGGVS